MMFNLTPTITISTADDLELALDSLAEAGTPEDWLVVLRQRAERHLRHPIVAAAVESLQRRRSEGLTAS